MLVPGTPQSPLQCIDARDLGAFTIHVTEAKAGGTFHATGPREPYTWGDLFEECRRVTGKKTSLTYVSEDFLVSRDVALPMRYKGADGLMRTSNAKAVAQGLTFRPMADTIRDTLEWDAAHGRRDVGLTPDRERELLARLHEELASRERLEADAPDPLLGPGRQPAQPPSAPPGSEDTTAPRPRPVAPPGPGRPPQPHPGPPSTHGTGTNGHHPGVNGHGLPRRSGHDDEDGTSRDA
jgi:hypothetical protein